MKLNELIKRFLASRALSVRPRTLEWYHYNLDPLAKALGHRDVAQMTTEDLEAWLASQAKGRSPKTQEGFHTAMNTLFRWAVKRDYLASSPTRGIPSPRRKRQKRIPDIFTDAEIRAMLRAVDNRRDRAIILTLLDTGIRRDELLGLNVEDIDFQEGFIKVRGKGNKERFVPIEALAPIREYLLEHPGHGALWRNRYDRRLQAGGLRSMLLRLRDQAGLDCRVYPHKFRHSFARNYLEHGDLESLRDILGHEDITITSRFYACFLRGSLKEKHRRCSPVRTHNWDQSELF